jgi:ech hydrogenase subunit C
MIKKSPWVCHFSASGCNGCTLEIVGLFTPKHDIERFGALLRESPRHADILIIDGPMNKKAKQRIKTIYSQMAEKKKVLCVGSCAISGGAYAGSYNLSGPIDKVVPVDMYVVGCPPRPEAIMHGVVKLLSELDEKNKKRSKKV